MSSRTPPWLGRVADLAETDRAFVRRALVDMLGDDAEHVAAWDRLTAET